MYNLPEEVKLRIVTFIRARNDLKSLRLVNKEYTVPATRVLLGTLFVHFREESLQRLMQISKQPSLCSLVTNIVYAADGDVQDYWKPSQLWQQLGWTETAESRVTTDEYVGIALDESSRLASSMTNLPNVRNVQFESVNSEGPNEGVTDATSLTEDLWVTPRNLRGHGVRSFLAMMSAASVTLSTLRYLEVSQLFHGLHYNFLDLESVDMRHASRVFKDLRRIIIYIDTEEGEAESQRVLAKGLLGKLLTTATQLEHLSIGFDQRPGPRISFSDLVGSGTWSNLSNLSIIGVDFHLIEMTQFIGRHPYITQIGLSNCKLHTGTLKLLLESLRDDLDLLVVDLDGTMGDQDGELDFLEFSHNRQEGIDFVLGYIAYPEFEWTIGQSS